MNADFEKLASQAEFAALVVAPLRGFEHALLFLDAEPDKAVCRELSDRGYKPVALFAWVKGEGLKWAADRDLLRLPIEKLLPFARMVSLEFLAAMYQRKPEDRAKAN